MVGGMVPPTCAASALSRRLTSGVGLLARQDWVVCPCRTVAHHGLLILPAEGPLVGRNQERQPVSAHHQAKHSPTHRIAETIGLRLRSDGVLVVPQPAS